MFNLSDPIKNGQSSLDGDVQTVDTAKEEFDRWNGICRDRIRDRGSVGIGNVETSKTEASRDFEFEESSEFVDRYTKRSENDFCDEVRPQNAAQSFETLGSYFKLLSSFKSNLNYLQGDLL